MKRLLVIGLVCAFSCCLHAQVVDTTVCDILKNPQSFNGKIVRVKGTVTAGLAQFVIKGTGCHQHVSDIWLSYPEGTKAKAGPAILVQMQPARNFAGTVAPVERTPVTLEKSKDFKQFDSELAQPYKGNGMCIGCGRNNVSATLVGRLDGADVALHHDASGKIALISGFGHLNAYPARLVLQSVSDVTAQEIDYSKIAPITKGEVPLDAQISDPLAAIHLVAKAFGPGNAAGEDVERSANTFGTKLGEGNGVFVAYNGANEVSTKSDVKGDVDSADGVLFNCTFDKNRLKDTTLAIAIAYAGSQIADIRAPKSAAKSTDIYDLESHAGQTAILCGIANRLKTFTLPGGYMVWNAAWTPEERTTMADKAFRTYLTEEELLTP
jgi:hypothetical protein